IFLVKRAFKMAQLHDRLQVVTDGQEAINYLAGAGKYSDRAAYPLPKLIVMDIKMPRLSGFEVLDWVKGEGRPLRRIPVIIVSSPNGFPSNCSPIGSFGDFVNPQGTLIPQRPARLAEMVKMSIRYI